MCMYQVEDNITLEYRIEMLNKPAPVLKPKASSARKAVARNSNQKTTKNVQEVLTESMMERVMDRVMERTMNRMESTMEKIVKKMMDSYAQVITVLLHVLLGVSIFISDSLRVHYIFPFNFSGTNCQVE